MNKKDKVIRLELAKKIAKEYERLGIEAPESEYYYGLDAEATRRAGRKVFHLGALRNHYDFYPKQTEHYRAYDVAELGGVLLFMLVLCLHGLKLKRE